MPIGKALLLKGLGGLAALGGAIGTGCYIYNRNRNLDTKFDRGLIEFLEADDSTNIQFSVKDGNEGSSTEITDNFPSFTANSGSQTKTATVTIKVSVGTATGNDGGTLTNKTGATDGALGTKKYLQKLNGDGTNDGTAWTWVCEVKFTVENTTDASALTLSDKDKLVKSAESKGFFNKLKDTDASNKHKELKIKFIRDCAAARGKDKNKKIDELTSLTATDGVITTNNEIKSTKEFKLRKGNTASSEDATKLYPVDKSDFNYWFGIK